MKSEHTISRHTGRSALTAVLALAALPACEGRECTLIGYSSGFTATFESDAWMDGRYEIRAEYHTATIDTPGVTVLCKVQIASVDGAPSVASPPECALVNGETAAADLAHSLPLELRVEATPKSVRLQVTRDDLLLHEGEHEVKYRESEPNGEGCGTARNAQLAIPLR